MSEGRGLPVNYESALIWINYMIEKQAPVFTWQQYGTCRNIVDSLNRAMEKLPWFVNKLRSPHTINEFVRERGLR
jgi:hypothetical protein